MSTILSQPLNPALYEVLQRFAGGVLVSNAGQQQVVRTRPDPDCPTHVLTEAVQHGEQYRVNCAFCGDTRHRLYMSYRYGQPDPRSGRPNHRLWFCQNESRCHTSRTNQNMLRAMTAIPLGCRARNRVLCAVPPAASDSVTDFAPPAPAELPPGSAPIDTLPDSNPAVQYLRGRGFEVAELARVWDVRHVSGWAPTPAANRILIPIYRPAHHFGQAEGESPVTLAGWQARFVGALADGTPKYLFPSDFKKAKVLYGLPAAMRSSGPVYLCEGTTDVWKLGPGAVAPFGKQISRDQLLLLVHYFRGRPIVVLFDDDAANDAEQVVRDLTLARGFGGGDNRVVLGQLPLGRQDPGDCTPEEIWVAAATALNAPIDEVIPHPLEGVPRG